MLNHGSLYLLKFIVFKNKKDDTHTELDRPGIRLWRRYPHSTPGEQAPRSPSGVCAPASCYARGVQDRVQIQSLHIQRKEKMGFRMESHFSLEVQAGFEPADNGVADRGLTTWLLHQISNYPNIIAKFFCFVKGKRKKILQEIVFFENG